MSEKLTVWTNTTDRNNHSVVAEDGKLTLTVIKPDGTPWSDTKDTISTPSEWQAAFSGLGSKWHQDEGSEVIDGPRYQAIRRTRTPQEEVVWTVDHEKVGDTQHIIRDKLSVVLLGK